MSERIRSLATQKGPLLPGRPDDEMNPHLKKAYKRIQKLFSAAEEKDVSARYEIGSVVVQIKDDPKKYGEAPVPRLAKALGLDDKTLYAYGEVARTWSARQLQLLISKRNTFRIGLTWSHLNELIRVQDKRERVELIDRVLKEGLSVRALRELINEEDPGRKVVPTLSYGLRKITSASHSLIEQGSKWEKLVFDQIDQARVEKLTPELLDQLRKAEEATDALEAHCRANKKKLAASIARVREAMGSRERSEALHKAG